MNKINMNWQDVQDMCIGISQKIITDDWIPDYVVGIVRDGAVPATIISSLLETPLYMIKFDPNDKEFGSESNLWMAEDAYGYDNKSLDKDQPSNDSLRNILIVDSINWDGKLIEWIKEDWQSSCLPYNTFAWDNVWSNNVRFVSLLENENAPEKSNYIGQQLNDEFEPLISLPWNDVKPVV